MVSRKKDLQVLLAEELHGVQRVPPLLYRCALILVTKSVIGRVSEVVAYLLQTLVEIQAVAYSNEGDRSEEVFYDYTTLQISMHSYVLIPRTGIWWTSNKERIA